MRYPKAKGPARPNLRLGRYKLLENKLQKLIVRRPEHISSSSIRRLSLASSLFTKHNP